MSLLHDPYKLLVDYLKIRVAGTASLFTLQDGLSVTRTWFREHVFSSGEIYGLPKGLYATHSCRAGGATYLASKGLSDGELKKRGRWTSNTFLKYIRQLDEVDILVMEATGGNVPQNMLKAINLPPTSSVTPPPQHWINKYGMSTPPNKKLNLETLQKQKAILKAKFQKAEATGNTAGVKTGHSNKLVQTDVANRLKVLDSVSFGPAILGRTMQTVCTQTMMELSTIDNLIKLAQSAKPVPKTYGIHKTTQTIMGGLSNHMVKTTPMVVRSIGVQTEAKALENLITNDACDPPEIHETNDMAVTNKLDTDKADKTLLAGNTNRGEQRSKANQIKLPVIPPLHVTTAYHFPPYLQAKPQWPKASKEAMYVQIHNTWGLATMSVPIENCTQVGNRLMIKMNNSMLVQNGVKSAAISDLINSTDKMEINNTTPAPKFNGAKHFNKLNQ